MHERIAGIRRNELRRGHSVLACKVCRRRIPDRQAPVSEGGVLDSSGGRRRVGVSAVSIVGHGSDVR